jgi:methylase of polypeptide subunit release factors
VKYYFGFGRGKVNEQIKILSSSWGESDAEKGEVFTSPEIVRFMLNTSGICHTQLVPSMRILEPSCGQGEFVIEIANILCKKLSTLDVSDKPRAEEFKNLITAYDISTKNISIAKKVTSKKLALTFSQIDADSLVNHWYHNEDFLLSDIDEKFSHIVGNPPYVRIENIPEAMLKFYRSKFSTMKDRADLYIAFFEKSLSLLKDKGILNFICTDRWTKNRYGSYLRDFISKDFQLDLFIDLYGQSAFQSDVLTYPAITQISKRKQIQTIVVHNPNITDEFSEDVKTSILDNSFYFPGKIVRKDLIRNSRPWLFGSADELALIARLERDFPIMEKAGCQVYIGAASGNKAIYEIDKTTDIEDCRKLPLVRAKDIKNGKLTFTQLYMINTYERDGIINLDNYPKLKIYLEIHRDELMKRHIAKLSPSKWFKTIDRVYPERAKLAKLLIPDIKSQLTTFLDEEGMQPNNSLYYICSKDWSLKALQTVLMSGIGQFFVEMYSTKISGGNLRFQAQHLRKIRLPLWSTIPQSVRDELEAASALDDAHKSKELVFSIYNFSLREKQIIGC